jgi:hypothetical protein
MRCSTIPQKCCYQDLFSSHPRILGVYKYGLPPGFAKLVIVYLNISLNLALDQDTMDPNGSQKTPSSTNMRSSSVDENPFNIQKKNVSTLLRENPFVLGLACVCTPCKLQAWVDSNSVTF